MDKRIRSYSICGHRIRQKVPFLFLVGEEMTKRGIRGGHRLAKLACKRAVVEYDLDDGNWIVVPMYRDDNRLSRTEILNYESQLITAMTSAAGSTREFTLVDCGADIGMISVLLARQMPAIRHIFAFEPNPEVLPYLSLNLSMIPCAAVMIGHGAGDSIGMGTLLQPAYDQSDHARFLVGRPEGDVRIVTIDSLDLRGNIILKIDVEGGESAVLQGAQETIRRAAHCIVSVEAHPDVARRTGRDPVELLRHLQAIRPFRFVVTDVSTSWELTSLDQPIFAGDQSTRVLNVIASSSPTERSTTTASTS